MRLSNFWNLEFGDKFYKVNENSNRFLDETGIIVKKTRKLLLDLLDGKSSVPKPFQMRQGETLQKKCSFVFNVDRYMFGTYRFHVHNSHRRSHPEHNDKTYTAKKSDCDSFR